MPTFGKLLAVLTVAVPVVVAGGYAYKRVAGVPWGEAMTKAYHVMGNCPGEPPAAGRRGKPPLAPPALRRQTRPRPANPAPTRNPKATQNPEPPQNPEASQNPKPLQNPDPPQTTPQTPAPAGVDITQEGSKSALLVTNAVYLAGAPLPWLPL
jgi:hypothetical protein